MGPQECANCGRNPATGFAQVNDERYCHGDFDQSPTCYERVQLASALTTASAARWRSFLYRTPSR